MTQSITNEVRKAIDAFFGAMDEQDLEAISRLTAHDEQMVNIGTDSGEYWKGWERLQEDTAAMFKTMKSYKVSRRDEVINISESGTVAWFSFIMDSVVETEDGKHTTEDARFSGVMEKRNGQWKFVQSHLSIPLSGQAVAY